MSIEAYPSPNGVLTSLIWRKTMSGGETSLSGYDNASQALSYTPGQEQVYLNGILLVRGDDYTATNGTSITGLSALAASDFVQINCYNNFSVATTPATSITGTIANNQLANSAITINGSAISLGGSVTLAGDIESVTAGTGLTGGGNSGALTLGLSTPVATTNGGTGLSTFTTGDLVYASGTDTLAKRSIGTTGQILSVSGGVPAWTAAPSPTYVGASVYKATTQSCNNGSDNIITWDAEYYDTHNIHDNVTNNSRLYVPAGYGGKWLINFQHCWAATATGAKWGYIYKNGVDVFGTFWTYTSAGSQVTHSASFVLQLAAGDYIDSRCGQNSGGALNLASGYSTQLQFSYLGA